MIESNLEVTCQIKYKISFEMFTKTRHYFYLVNLLI